MASVISVTALETLDIVIGGGGGYAAVKRGANWLVIAAGGDGGGGSWARQSLVDAGAVSDLLILGQSYDPGTPTVTLTFEVQQ